VDETLAIGRRIGAALEPGDVVALVGPLGAGKTHLVKGIAEGAGVADRNQVNSPTFVLINEYAGRLPIHHIDVYRLAGSDELEALGFEEMVSGPGAVLIEWADRVEDALPVDHLHVTLAVTGAERRELFINGASGRGAAMVVMVAGEASDGVPGA
jgi:tRNA threonylcarbamoyladenosine biosynthesis protein TsaE